MCIRDRPPSIPLLLSFCPFLPPLLTVPPFVPPYLLPYLTLPPLFPLLPGVESIRGFAHAAGFAAARRCLRFLVSIMLSARTGIDQQLRDAWRRMKT